MLEAGWPVVMFAVSGATEVAVVVSVRGPPGQAGVTVSQCEGDVVRGGEVAVNRVEGAPPPPPSPPP